MLSLPVRAPSPLDEALAPSARRKRQQPNRMSSTKLAGRNRTISQDPMTGETTVTVHRERASYLLPAIDLAFEADAEEHYRIREGDPSATTADTRATWRLSRGDWRIRTETRTRVGCTATSFEITATLEAFEGETRVANRPGRAASHARMCDNTEGADRPRPGSSRHRRCHAWPSA